MPAAPRSRRCRRRRGRRRPPPELPPSAARAAAAVPPAAERRTPTARADAARRAGVVLAVRHPRAGRRLLAAGATPSSRSSRAARRPRAARAARGPAVDARRWSSLGRRRLAASPSARRSAAAARPARRTASAQRGAAVRIRRRRRVERRAHRHRHGDDRRQRRQDRDVVDRFGRQVGVDAERRTTRRHLRRRAVPLVVELARRAPLQHVLRAARDDGGRRRRRVVLLLLLRRRRRVLRRVVLLLRRRRHVRRRAVLVGRREDLREEVGRDATTTRLPALRPMGPQPATASSRPAPPAGPSRLKRMSAYVLPSASRTGARRRPRARRDCNSQSPRACAPRTRRAPPAARAAICFFSSICARSAAACASCIATRRARWASISSRSRPLMPIGVQDELA